MEEHVINTEEINSIKCSRGNHYFVPNPLKINKTCPKCVEKMYAQKLERNLKNKVSASEVESKPKKTPEIAIYEGSQNSLETSVFLPYEPSVKPTESSVFPSVKLPESSVFQPESSVSSVLENTPSVLENTPSVVKNIEESLDKFDPSFLIESDETRHFKHPFSMKIYGMRGVGKTTWLINYMNEFNYFWDKFILISPTSSQDLFNYMNEDTQSKFVHLHLSKTFEANELITGKTLIIFDDCMADLLKDKELKFYVSQLYLRGRHPEKDENGLLIRLPVSVISIEQQIMSLGLKDQRSNSDYFLVNRIMDYTGLEQIKNMIGLKTQSNFFEAVKNYCWALQKPFLVSCNYVHKLRLNFNTGFEMTNNKLTLLNLNTMEKKVPKVIKDDNYFIQEIMFKIIEEYQVPIFRYVHSKTNLSQIFPMSADTNFEELKCLSENELHWFFTQNYINSAENYFKNKYDLMSYTKIRKHIYRIKLSDNYKFYLSELYRQYALDTAKTNYKKIKFLETFKALEKERIREKYSDYFMMNAYPEFYKNVNHTCELAKII